MNFAFLALACFAKKTSQKRSCTHPRIPPSRTARESGAPFTWKSHARDQNGKDGATRHQHHVSFRESTTRAGHPANSARERAPFFWDAGCKKPKREQGGPPVLHTCSQPTLRTSRLLRNSIILLPMVVAVQAKRNMLWFQKRNFEFRNNLTSRRVGHHIMCHLGKAQQGRGTRPPRKELGPGETCAFNVRL